MKMPEFNQVAKIKVFGIGGGGCNAVSRMIEEGVQGVEFYVANTDAQVLETTQVKNKIVLGSLGAGANPEIGRKSAEDHKDEIKKAMEGADMIYITAGMGGGTGTGAAPVFAKIAKEMGALTVGIVTKPFSFEGPRRTRQALEGLEELRKHVDSLIIVSNNQLLKTIGNIPLTESFKEADNVLRQGVQTVTDLIAVPSLINLDFADVRSVMEGQGNALIGIGIDQSDDRARRAAEKAIQSPLLEAKMSGAKKAIVNVTGGNSITIQDANDAAEYISEAAGYDLDIIFGLSINEKLGDAVVVTVIATGFDSAETKAPTPKAASSIGRTIQNERETTTTKRSIFEDDMSEIPSFFRNRF